MEQSRRYQLLPVPSPEVSFLRHQFLNPSSSFTTPNQAAITSLGVVDRRPSYTSSLFCTSLRFIADTHCPHYGKCSFRLQTHRTKSTFGFITPCLVMRWLVLSFFYCCSLHDLNKPINHTCLRRTLLPRSKSPNSRKHSLYSYVPNLGHKSLLYYHRYANSIVCARIRTVTVSAIALHNSIGYIGYIAQAIY